MDRFALMKSDNTYLALSDKRRDLINSIDKLTLAQWSRSIFSCAKFSRTNELLLQCLHIALRECNSELRRREDLLVAAATAQLKKQKAFANLMEPY